MLQQVNQTEARDLEWACEGVSPMDDSCGSVATFYCGICGRRFCVLHADDESWHPACSSRATKAARLKVIVDHQTLLKGLHDG